MEVIDVAILLLVLWALYHGWKQGLIREILSMLGFFVGLFVAYKMYDVFGEYLVPCVTKGYIAKVLAFCLLWVIVPILLGWVATLITKIINLIPLVGTVNHLGGALFSMAKFLILMSFILCAMDMFHIIDSKRRAASKLYAPVASIAKTFFEGKQLNVPHLFKKQCDTEDVSDTIWIERQE